jgi:hypothetical protein
MFIQPGRLALTTCPLNSGTKISSHTTHKQTYSYTNLRKKKEETIERENKNPRRTKRRSQPLTPSLSPAPVTSISTRPPEIQNQTSESANPCSDSPLLGLLDGSSRAGAAGGAHVARLRWPVLLGAGIGAAGAGQGRRGPVRVGVERRDAVAAVR